MANTPGFGWETPDNTDLVKDGALAMRTLGNAIDASLVDLKGGTTGQVLSKNTNTDMDFVWTTPQTGDITAVTAGTGLSGGGTSGDVTLTNTVATTFDAKGDLVVGTGADTFAKLVAGSNGDTLVADSSTTTGLRWQGDFNTGKNKILNSDFLINQRSFTSTTNANTYGLDRWQWTHAGGTNTYSVQSFTPGAAPVAGYEGRNFARIATTGQSASGNYTIFIQRVEDVTTFANQTTTLSFWAKANSGTPKVALEIEQLFGTGGSPSSSVLTYAGQVTLSTSWARYSITFNVPSISGKTLGTTANSSYLSVNLWTSAGSDFNARTGSIGIQNNTIDFWGVQWEAGSVATPFTTATGTLAGELAACQRYYYRQSATNVYSAFGFAWNRSSTQGQAVIQLPVRMRVAPTAVDSALLSSTVLGVSEVTLSSITINTNGNGNTATTIDYSGTSLQSGFVTITGKNDATAYLGFSAEL